MHSTYQKRELRTIAQVGLVGFPNAGKSSFLAATSNARPHVAPFPFTTLRPNVGVLEYSDHGRVTVADIPGLVDGAVTGTHTAAGSSSGSGHTTQSSAQKSSNAAAGATARGLGHDFLRHIERTSGLLFVLDAAGNDGRDPCEDLVRLVAELEAYEPGLSGRPSLVIANKVDLPAAQEHLPRLRALLLGRRRRQQEGGDDRDHHDHHDGALVGALPGDVRGLFETSMATGEGLREAVMALRGELVERATTTATVEDSSEILK